MSSLSGSKGPLEGRKLAGGYKQGQMQNYTPEQMDLFKSLFGQVSPDSYTSRLANGDENLFNEIESPAMRQFNELQGSVASRFSGGGGGRGALSSRNSSGFQNSMTAATSNFAQDLQSKRQSMQRQAIQDLMGMSNDLLSKKPYENYAVEKEQPWWKKLLGGALPLAGAGAGALFGGPAGASAGYSAGNAAGQAFQ